MSDITNYFEHAELALAAYSDLWNGMSQAAYEAALRQDGKGMSPAQATHFASTYSVAAQYNDPNGLSATVFADATGNTYLAIRGTDSAIDMITNVIGIALLGTTALQPQYASLKVKVQEWLGSGVLSPSFTVTGHSLGGFLATGIAADFAPNVSHAYLYNSPGVGGITSIVTSPILNALGVTSSFDPDKFSNLKADAGISPIAGLGYQVSPPISIAIEDQTAADVSNPPAARNHSQQVLTDALALYPVFSQLASNLTIEQIGAIVKAANSLSSPTLESALDGLRTILFGPGTTQTATGDRNTFYTNLYNLTGDARYTALAGAGTQLTVLAGTPAADLMAAAQAGGDAGLATRYALRELNPFALAGADYSAFNTDGALDLYDPATGTGDFTESYLADRANFLERKLWFSSEDKNPVNSSTDFTNRTHRFETDDTYFKDFASGYQIAQGFAPATPFPNIQRTLFGDALANTLTGGGVSDHLYGGSGDDTLNGNGGDDYLEGGADNDALCGNDGNDTLQGGTGDDLLVGGEGNDILNGGAGADTLNGGAGDDTYIINTGDGADTIIDSGKNRIIYNGQLFAGTFIKDAATGQYKFFLDNGKTLEFHSPGVLTLDASTSLTFQNQTSGGAFANNDFGFNLVDPAAASQTLTLVGDIAPIDQDPSEDGTQIGLDALGNTIGIAGGDANRNDTLYGSSGNDLLQSLGGNDTVDAKAGNDRIEAGTGDDFAYGGDGIDTLIGGSGSDRLLGQAGDDILYGTDEESLIQAYANGEQQTASGVRGDLFDGGSGNDIAIGSTGNDLIVGGSGGDTLYGGAGNDALSGDQTSSTPTASWSVATTGVIRQVTGANLSDVPEAEQGDDQLFGGSGSDLLDGAGGNDLLDGGIGDDALWGGAGDDILEAGDGNDFAVGGQGNDIVLGSAGDDALHGDGTEGFVMVTFQDQAPYPSGHTAPQLHGDDYIDGDDGNDTLVGDGGADQLIGGAGNDTLIGDSSNLDVQYHGDDTLDGGDGNDTLYGYGKNDTLYGGAGNDILEGDSSDVPYANHGDDYLDGEDGNDILKGDGGNDTLFGGAGNDQLFGDADDIPVANQGDDTLDGEDGDDYLRGYGGNDTLTGGAGADQLLGEAGDDTLQGGAGDDILVAGDGNDTLEGGTGTDTLDGGNGNDTYLLKVGAGETAMDGTTEAIADSAGTDTVKLEGVSATTLHVFAANGSDLVIDYGAADRVVIVDGVAGAVERFEVGGEMLTHAQFIGEFGSGIYSATDSGGTLHFAAGKSNDLITLAADNALISGGQGNDTLTLSGDHTTTLVYQGDGSDTLTLSGQDARIQFADQSADQIHATRNGNNLVLANDNGDSITVTGWLQDDGQTAALQNLQFADGTAWDGAGIRNALLASTTGDDHLIGYGSNDTISGGEGNDTLEGLGGADILTGDAGADDLDGGAGSDTLIGGAGADIYRLSPGSGADTALDGGADINTIRLESWQSPDSLRTVREGDDLKLLVKGASDSLTLKDYYADAAIGAPQSWAVAFGGANAISMENLLARPNPVTTAIDDLWNGTKQAVVIAQIWEVENLTKNYVPELGGLVGWRNLGDFTYEVPWASLPSDNVSHQVTTTTYRTSTGDFISGSQETIDNPSIAHWNYGSANPQRWLYHYNVNRIDSDSALITNAGSDHQETSQGSAIATIAWGGQQYGYQHKAWTDVGWFYDAEGYIQGVEHIYDLTSYQRRGAVTNYDDNTAGWTSPLNTIVGNQVLVDVTTILNVRDIITEIVAGSGDNEIHANSNAFELVDGGAGNDTIHGGRFVTINGFTAAYGDLLYGNSGDDMIFGDGSTLIGGDGSDKLYGGYGGDRYLVLSADETGVDIVEDRGSLDIADWYYQSRGINDWRAHEARAGQWELWSGEGGTFASREEVDAYFAAYQPGWSVEDALASGDLVYFAPLDPPLIGDSKDFRLIESSGLGPQDAVELPEGLTQADLSFGWGTTEDGAGTLRATLEVAWHGATRLRLVMPRADDPIGFGIEYMKLADGSHLWMSQAIDLAPPIPDIGDGTRVGNGDDNVIAAGDAGEHLFGMGGDDTLIGGTGADTLDGGYGNDTLNGGAGNDVYVFRRDDGQDVVLDHDAVAGNVDTVFFAAAIVPADVSVSREGTNLVLALQGTEDRLTLSRWFEDASHKVERVEFLDGTRWDADYLLAQVSNGPTILGDGVDDFTGSEDGEVIEGRGGNDALYGNGGDDFINGGAGDDVVSGGTGNDVYYFARGDGHDMLLQNDSAAGDLDVVRFADGITPEAVAVSTANGGADLVLTIAGAGGSLTLLDWFYPSGERISEVQFADGTVWDAATLAGLTSSVLIGTEADDTLLGLGGNDELFGGGGDDTLVGASGDDSLYGEDGNDTLKGGTGDDSLEGGAGDDVLRGGAGNDRYYVDAASGHDTIVETPGSFGTNDLMFGPDVSPDSLGFTRYAGDGNDLLITLGSGDATVKLNNWFNGANSARVAAFEFDGQSWDANAIDAAIWANNSAPVVSGNWSRQILIDQVFNLNVKQGMFADPDGDRLAYSATSADGSPLPAWLAFDATTGKFSGTPAATDVGLLGILVTAQDAGGLSASNALTLNVRTNTPASVAIVDQVVGLGTSFDVAPLLTVTDAEGDVLTMYQFRDTPEGGGYLALDGIAQPALTTITVTSDQLAGLQYVGGAVQGDGKLKVRAYDGFAWGAWSNWDVVSSDHATNVAPDVVAIAERVSLNAVAAASTLFGVSDADGDAIQKYQLIDTAEGGGYLTFGGVTQTAGAHIEVSTAQLASLDYVGGNVQSTEKLKARAWDGLAWGAWTAWDMASSDHATNAAPVATAANRGILAGQALAAGSLFSITDADGDAPTQYQFWDAVNGGGYFRVNDTAQAAGAAITVAASDLASINYVGGAGNATIETVKVRANDGLGWGAWKSWKMTTTGYQQGGSGNDTLTGTGSDILLGGAGNDTLSTPSGNGLLAGGEGNDTLTGGSGADFYVGNSGNDTIHTGSGATVVAFNAGDGQDAVYFGGTQASTLSLGGGIGYQNLALSQSGNDLVLETGASESITLKDWYAGSATHGQTNLQLIAEAMAGFDAQSADPLYNARVQIFDLDALAADFDAARAGDATLTRWSVMDRLLESHLAGSDGGALGGDLAYQYGMYGNLGNVGTTGARNVLEGSQYGVGIQSFQSFSGLQEGVARLG